MTMLRTTWVYYLKRDDLLTYLSEFNLDTAGTVEDLRKRLAKFISGEHDTNEFQRLIQIQTKHEVASTSPVPSLVITSENQTMESPIKDERNKPSNHEQAETTASSKTEMRINTIDQVRKWGIKYDGTGDPLEFIERVEELSQMYCVSLDNLPPIMPEFLCRRSLMWFRNNNDSWPTWAKFKQDFCTFFLPSRYYEKLDDDILKRKQKPREPFKDYVLSLQDLMRRSNLTETQKLE